jgi:hypothetical protein
MNLLSRQLRSAFDGLYKVRCIAGDAHVNANDRFSGEEAPEWTPDAFPGTEHPFPDVRSLSRCFLPGFKLDRELDRGSTGVVFLVSSLPEPKPENAIFHESRGGVSGGTVVKVSPCKSGADALRGYAEWTISSNPDLEVCLDRTGVLYPKSLGYACVRCPLGFVWSVHAMTELPGKPLRKATGYPDFGLQKLVDINVRLKGIVSAMLEDGFVHRDLNGKNVFVYGDRLGLLDFENVACRCYTSSPLFPREAKDLDRIFGMKGEGISPKRLTDAMDEVLSYYYGRLGSL